MESDGYARGWQADRTKVERGRFTSRGHEAAEFRILFRCNGLPTLREGLEQRIVLLEARPQRVVIHHRVVETALQVLEEIEVEHVAPRVRVTALVGVIPCAKECLHPGVQDEEPPHERLDRCDELRLP